MSRREGFFRGSELPRLLILLGIVAVGWMLVARYGGRRTEPPPPTPAVAVRPWPPADPAPVFAEVRDREWLREEENPAYALLLRRARETPPDRLAAEARRDVALAQIVERPRRFRGVPIHVEGTALRIAVVDELPPGITPRSRLYEAWTFTPDAGHFPYLLVSEEVPPDLPAGDHVHEPVRFDGYFFKILKCQARDRSIQYAPLLVGRLSRPPGATGAAAGRGGSMRWTLPLLLVALFAYLALRVIVQLRRTSARRPAWSPPRGRDDLSPDELQGWLATQSREPDDEHDP